MLFRAAHARVFNQHGKRRVGDPAERKVVELPADIADRFIGSDAEADANGLTRERGSDEENRPRRLKAVAVIERHHQRRRRADAKGRRLQRRVGYAETSVPSHARRIEGARELLEMASRGGFGGAERSGRLS